MREISILICTNGNFGHNVKHLIINNKLHLLILFNNAIVCGLPGFDISRIYGKHWIMGRSCPVDILALKSAVLNLQVRCP